MQPNELYHGVVVARTEAAQAALRAWDVDASVDVEHLALPGAVDLHLFAGGVLDAINDACGSTIGEYEQEWLEGEQVGLAQRCVDGLRRQRAGTHLERWLADLGALLARARDGGFAVYWLL